VVIDIIVVVVFQNVFCLEMHENIIFFILKKLFLISAHQNNPKNQKKNFKKNFNHKSK